MTVKMDKYEGSPLSRQEHTEISVTLKADQVTKYRYHINTILEGEPISNLISGCNLVLKYNFYIQYLGNCTKIFQSFREILKDSDAVLKVDLKELVHGECLLDELLKSLRELKKQIEERK